MDRVLYGSCPRLSFQRATPSGHAPRGVSAGDRVTLRRNGRAGGAEAPHFRSGGGYRLPFSKALRVLAHGISGSHVIQRRIRGLRRQSAGAGGLWYKPIIPKEGSVKRIQMVVGVALVLGVLGSRVLSAQDQL